MKDTFAYNHFPNGYIAYSFKLIDGYAENLVMTPRVKAQKLCLPVVPKCQDPSVLIECLVDTFFGWLLLFFAHLLLLVHWPPRY